MPGTVLYFCFGFAVLVLLLLAFAYVFATKDSYEPAIGDIITLRKEDDLPTGMHPILRDILIAEEKSEDFNWTNMIIGIHATLKNFGAYCINLSERKVYFYNLEKAHFPWQLSDLPDNTEFQMRNFSFALMAFFDNIKEAKRFSMFVGSHNTTFDNNRLGRRANKLLDHYITCEQLSVTNEGNHFLSVFKNQKSHAVRIFPAKYLAENNLEAFVQFISNYYGIPRNNFIGSHAIPSQPVPGIGEKDLLKTEHYLGYIEKVKQLRTRFSKPCDKCAYYDDEANKKRSIVGGGVDMWIDGVILPIESESNILL